MVRWGQINGPGSSDQLALEQVNDLVARAGIHQSGVSRHLHTLHVVGFVSVRPDGQRRLYSLGPEPGCALDR